MIGPENREQVTPHTLSDQISHRIARATAPFRTKLDQMVLGVRRLCQPLESHFLGKKRPGVPDETRRLRMLKDHRTSSNLHSNLEKVIDGKRGKLVRHVTLNWNFPFAPKNFKHTKMRYGLFSFVNPVLVRRILDPLDAGKPENDKRADDLWNWVRENIYLPREFVDVYEKERTKRIRVETLAPARSGPKVLSALHDNGVCQIPFQGGAVDTVVVRTTLPA
jgi:hypothetical protein